MYPRDYTDDAYIIEPSLDHSLLPPSIPQGLNILAPHGVDFTSFEDGYADYPEIDFFEYKNHY